MLSQCRKDSDCTVVVEAGQEPKCVSVTCDTATGLCVPVIKKDLIIEYSQQKAAECYAEPLVCDPQGKSFLDTDPSKRVEANEGGACTQPSGAEPPTVCQKAVCAQKKCVVKPDSSAAGKSCGEPTTANCKRITYECSANGKCGELALIAPGAECAPDGTLAPKDRLPPSFAALYTSLPELPLFTCDGEVCKIRYCGDGFVNNKEECDGAARAAGVPAEAVCDSKTCLASFCGDGVISGEETCDKKADGTLIFKAGIDLKSKCDMKTCAVPACSGATGAGWIRCDLQPPVENLTYALTTNGSKASCKPGKCLAFCDEVSGYIFKDGVCKKENPEPVATTGGGGGANQCPAIPDSCGSGCRSAPYPTCVVCDEPCTNNKPITYYTADGQCLMATSWGPSQNCCPSVGCDIKAHGYGDKQDDTGEWYKMVNITDSCPSQRGKLLGGPVRCPTCKCTSKLDCISESGGGGYKMIAEKYRPRYGHEVFRDASGAREAVGGDKCWCVPVPNACPPGYKELQPFNLEIEYTPIEQTVLLDRSSCKSSNLP